MDNGMINQIILVTDGQSNIGGDPAQQLMKRFHKEL